VLSGRWDVKLIAAAVCPLASVAEIGWAVATAAEASIAAATPTPVAARTARRRREGWGEVVVVIGGSFGHFRRLLGGAGLM
jgi:hypothetical protein